MSSSVVKSFYLSLVGCCAIAAFSGCANKAEEQAAPPVDSNMSRPLDLPKPDVAMMPTPTANGELFKIEYTQRALDSLITMPDAKQLATPESAAQYNLTMPPKMTVPPHMMPSKDVKLVSKTDSTATVSFAATHSPMTGTMELKRYTKDSSHVWLIQTVVTEHKP